MGLVLPLLKYMKLNSKSSLVVSFICNSHCLCSWLNSSKGVRWKPFVYFVYVIWPVDRRDRVENCCVCLTRNIVHQVSEKTLLIVKFRFVPKSRRKSILCSREISLERPQIVTRTYARTFLESSREQRTKFAHFACVTFAQYCTISTPYDLLQETSFLSVPIFRCTSW